MSFHQQVCLYMKLMAFQSSNLRVCVFMSVLFAVNMCTPIAFYFLFPPLDLLQRVCVTVWRKKSTFSLSLVFFSQYNLWLSLLSKFSSLCAFIYHTCIFIWFFYCHFFGEAFFCQHLRFFVCLVLHTSWIGRMQIHTLCYSFLMWGRMSVCKFSFFLFYS